MKVLRCAVYTRKSTEDGLEQEFNSLHAQREACEAYILSQRHEGWALVPTAYNDGGFSGGNMTRPGIISLLADVDAGLVDVIVVYKVDRLTRSLADFAKIVERLDARQASFVSVTQAFNTTTSMGRLTLNVLLSFAQFEREVTGERIRDKIAASKKKGLWMGGPVPLGYEVIARKLVVVPEEAKRVRWIMQRYLEIKSVPELIVALRNEEVVTKIQPRASGPHRGGIPFARGSLFHLLKNPIYRGKIVHKGSIYEGEHEPIVDEALWLAVQAQLQEKAPSRSSARNDPQKALLQGLVIDPHGRPMVPTYTTKGTRRYCYYETRKDLACPNDPAATRVPRSQLDSHLVKQLAELMNDEHTLRRVSGIAKAGQLRDMFAQARRLAVMLEQSREKQSAIGRLVCSINIHTDSMTVVLNAGAIGITDEQPLQVKIALPVRKPFREARLKIDAVTDGRRPDPSLIKLLADAYEVQRLVLASPDLSLNALGKREGRCRTQLNRLLRLSWISPKIVEAIIAGKQPKGITRVNLLKQDLPAEWAEQERLLSFVPSG